MDVARRARRGLVVALCALGGLAAAAAALAAASYSDPVGDNNAAPDVTAVTVSESAEGLLSVSVSVSNYQALPADSWVNLWFDLDSNPNTGDDGDEALVRYLDDGGLQFYRWSGSDLVRRPATGMTATYTAGVLTFTGPKSAFDDATTFGVLVVGSRSQVLDDEDLVAGDFAPNSGRGRYVAPGPFALTDPAGDHEAAPDIAGVGVTDSRSGTITFTVATPSHVTLSGDTWIELDVDIDRRGATGGGGGSELYVALSRGEVFVGRWSASEQEFLAVRRSGARVQSSAGVVTFQVPRRLLDDVASFKFYLVSGNTYEDADVDNAIDLAPDGDALWSYRLQYKPPLRLIAGEPRTKPAQPRAGAPFTVSVPVRRSDTARAITSGSAACNVRVAGRAVRAVGRVGLGLARCSAVLPDNASGAVARGSMTVRSAGKAVTVPFAFRVRR